MPSISDLMNIYSSTDSLDTWSRSRDEGDDDTEASWPVRYVRDGEYDTHYDMEHVRKHKNRRRRKIDKRYLYSESDNSIVASPETSRKTSSALNESSTTLNETQETSFYRSDPSESFTEEFTTEEEYSPRRRISTGRNPFDESSTHEASVSSSVQAAAPVVGRNPFDDDCSISNNPSDEVPASRRSSTGSRTHPWEPPLLPNNSSSGLDEISELSRPLTLVEEGSSSFPSPPKHAQPSHEYPLPVSDSARHAQEQLLRTFHQKRQEQSRRIPESHQEQERALRHEKQAVEAAPLSPISDSSSVKNQSNTTEETVSSAADDNNNMDADQNFPLHDLCSEATSPDDVAWRNALYLLSIEPEAATVKMDGFSPLHVSCLGSAPPPDFIVRGLLMCHSACARAVDDGGRLPLHMIAASSADPTIMQLLLDDYPQAVYKTDDRGLTPLHMLLRNDEGELTMERVRILLGQTVSRKPAKKERILQRRGQHLEMNVEEINNRMVSRPNAELDISFESQESDGGDAHEMRMHGYPDDVKVAFQKLAKWKRKQKRLRKDGEEPSINIEVAQSLVEEEKNPAAIAAPPSMQLPLHMVVRRKDPIEESFDDEDEEEYFDVRNPPPNHNEIVRVILSAHPKGLISRDANGHTPLMITLLNQDCLPSLELIQLLLGMRTSGYESPPPWAEDLPLHESLEGRYTNPAMVPAYDSNQLPLHVAAEEMPSFFAAIESIHSSYPGAVHVQDVRGRTPLHMALRNYQKIQPDSKVIALLLTDKVAQIRDDDGFLPFDLLVGGAHNLPETEPMPSRWEDPIFDPSSVYKKFFLYVVMQAPRPRNRAESIAFLQRLRRLPPWLRRQACTVGFVQDMLIEETSSMGNCAIILASGLVWALLLLSFRLQMDTYTKTGEAAAQYAPVIYLLTSLILLDQVIKWCMSAVLSVFVSQCLLNIWPWIDLASASVTIASTAMIQGGSSDERQIASFGTAATGLLWFSLIGYFARWWYGMAVFMGRTLRMSHVLVWPLIAALVLVVAFAQMFFTYNLTTSQENCVDVLGGRSLCNIREAFITVYLMLLGTPLIDTEDETTSDVNSGSVVLISVFTVLLVLFIVSLLISVVSEAVRIDLDDVALGYFWEPKLNFALMADDLTSCCTRSRNHSIEPVNGTGKKRLIQKRTLGERLSEALGDAWIVVDYAILGGE